MGFSSVVERAVAQLTGLLPAVLLAARLVPRDRGDRDALELTVSGRHGEPPGRWSSEGLDTVLKATETLAI
jgi:hypothetical protein